MSRRPRARLDARLRGALALGALLTLGLTPASGHAQETYVIGPGHEAEVQALFAPRRLGDEVGDGFVFYSLEIHPREIVVGVRKDGVDHLARLRHAGSSDARAGSLSIAFDTQDVAARAALARLVSSLDRDDAGRVWTRVAVAPRQARRDTPVEAPRAVGAASLWLAHAALLLGLLLALATWTRGRRERTRLVLTVAATCALWTAAWFGATSPEGLALGAMSGLQEGTTRMVINLLAGRGAHVGANLELWQRLWIDAGTPFKARVWWNAWLTGVDLLLFAGITQAALRRPRWTLTASVVFLLSPTTLLMATSESPAAILGLYLFSGVLLAAGLACAQTPGRRRPLTLALGAGAYVLAQTRVEWLAVGAPAVAAALSYEPAVERVLARPLAWAERKAREPTTRRAAIGAVIAWLALAWVPLPATVAQLVSMSHGLIRAALVWLPRVAGLLPGACIAFGSVLALRRWRQTLLLPCGVLAMAGAYLVMGHGGDARFEMWRYFTMLMPASWLLMLTGLSGLDAFARRRLGAGARRLASPLALAMTALTLPLWWFEWPPPGVQQRELHYLGRTLEEHPHCAILAPVTAAEVGASGHDLEELTWALFGRGRQVRTAAIAEPARAVLERLAPDATCHLRYHSATCSLAGAPPCPPLGARGERLEERSLPNTAYYVHVRYRDPVVLYLVSADATTRPEPAAGPPSAEDPVEEDGGAGDGQDQTDQRPEHEIPQADPAQRQRVVDGGRKPEDQPE